MAAAVKPRLGFLGVGWIGRNRLEAVAASEVAEIAAVADPASELAEQAAGAVPGVARLGSLDQLLEADLDGIVIATPSALHAEQAVAALERGMAVFCQKPLGRDAAETGRVLAAARRADRLLGVDMSYRFTEAMRHVRQAVVESRLGDVFAADLVFHNAYGPDKPWFYDRERSGGGCVMDLGIHLVDLALWTLGWPEVKKVSSSLFCRGSRLEPPLQRSKQAVEDYALAELTLATGAEVRIACSWNLPAGQDAVIQAAFFGTEGGAAMRNLNGSFYDFCAEAYRGTAREVLSRPPDAWGGRAIVDWARRLTTGQGFDEEAEELLAVSQVLDRIYGR
jgi:predicted dehydrogenase